MSNRTLMDCAQAALMYSEEDARIIADAADEIERLRASNESLIDLVETQQRTHEFFLIAVAATLAMGALLLLAVVFS